MLKRLVLAAAVAALPSLAWAADDYPARPIAIVVPSQAGGLSDILARKVADKAAPELHGVIIVDNKPGASGAIGGNYVRRAAPDGYTLLLANGASHGALPYLTKTPPYDPIKDFVPIARVGETQLALVASKKLPVKNAQDLLAYARKNPGKLTYGTFGHASAGHLFGEVMKKENGIEMVHVPYKGEGAVMQALMAGEIDLAMIVSAKPYVDQGQVTLIGITSPEGAAAYPDWPTLASQGVKGFSQARGFQVFLAPVGTPQPIIDKLANAFSDAIADPALRKQLLDLGVSPASEKPQDVPALYRELVSQWKGLVESSGVSSD
ncbi:tripartite tricarboxylate transporter substrate binding protein [Aquabacter sp. L1I39]|uniref:Bug family tripartite tricarboxylate transporter substrate binding protein n=1 Tax=Aquabacter sp. L1I39 TaxID=2820278 RepID=UPI001ADCB628|nr:tripartite tricarboxylate transporter substrate binding protein [Aquabacter sp. L1I39]QTL03481.1 tripartite tricarboxylate transporter substrate binding protein [Aquabacter sp. L1I39]